MGFFKDSLKKWFYQNSSSAVSSDARIPLLTATGEPKGSDTMANIASVLGAKLYGDCTVLGDGTDLNELKSVGSYRANGSILANSCLHKPSITFTDGFILFVFNAYGANNTYYQNQILYTADRIFIRYNDRAWGNWKEISTDVPTFYKDYNTLDSLASGLSTSLVAGFKKVTSAVTDISELGNGIFYVGNASHVPNIPSGYASHAIAIIRFPSGGTSKATIVIDLEGTVGIYTRFSDNGTFHKQ